MRKTLLALTLTSLLALVAGCSKSASSGDGLSEGDLNAQREARFADGSIPTAEGEGMFKDVFFGYDSSIVSDAERYAIETNARVLKEQSGIKVTLEGHCDERGTNDYNLALGQARARAVQQVLVSLGIPRSRIETISYGEEVPLDPGHDEGAWAKNRRVHFSASGSQR